MLQASARNLIAAAAIGLAIGGATAPIGVAPAQAAEHARSTPAQQAENRAKFGPDRTKKTGCDKYTPDSPQYKDCMAQ